MSEAEQVPFDTIVKIQRPLAWPRGTLPKALIYNKDRSIFTEVDLFDVSNLFRKNLKIYHRASINEKGILTIGERVEDQEW